MTTQSFELRLIEDNLTAGSALELPADGINRVVYVAHGSVEAGGKRFGEATRENTGHLFAIVLDNKVISAPVIREPILGGSGVISGHFTTQSAQDLALLLRAGALPAPLTVLEERTVGPGLGQDSIDAGKRAAYVGAGLVVVYMLITYGVFGVFANLALFVHIAFIFAGSASYLVLLNMISNCSAFWW